MAAVASVCQEGVHDRLHVQHIGDPVAVDISAGDDPRVSFRPQEHIDDQLNIQHVHLAVLINVLSFRLARRRGGRWA